MRILLNSLCFLLVLGCASYPERNGFGALSAKDGPKTSNPYFSKESKDYLYKANLSLYKKEFSGILIVKKLGTDRHRVAFTTEMGNKIFDFTFTDDDGFKVNYILNQIDKKPIIKLLKNDFRLLTQESRTIAKAYTYKGDRVYEVEKDIYFYRDAKSGKLKQIVRTKRTKAQLSIRFPLVNGAHAERIEVVHRDIDLTISLRAI